jgi:polyisoprenoid-binding protein YceI
VGPANDRLDIRKAIKVVAVIETPNAPPGTGAAGSLGDRTIEEQGGSGVRAAAIGPIVGSMSVIAGTYALGPAAGKLLVKTTRTGLGSKIGHDLTIEVTRWSGTATVDTADPASSSARVDVEVDSFQVREGTGGLAPLTDGDRAEIHRIIREKVLRTVRYPTIAFRSTAFRGTLDSFELEGDLTIRGDTHPVTVSGNLSEGRVHGEATVTQSKWGIKPYSAVLGALRLRDDVGVEFDLDLR